MGTRRPRIASPCALLLLRSARGQSAARSRRWRRGTWPRRLSAPVLAIIAYDTTFYVRDAAPLSRSVQRPASALLAILDLRRVDCLPQRQPASRLPHCSRCARWVSMSVRCPGSTPKRSIRRILRQTRHGRRTSCAASAAATSTRFSRRLPRLRLYRRGSKNAFEAELQPNCRCNEKSRDGIAIDELFEYVTIARKRLKPDRRRFLWDCSWSPELRTARAADCEITEGRFRIAGVTIEQRPNDLRRRPISRP